MTTHHMGNGFNSPCGLEPASVYHGFEGSFTTDWSDVDCADCLAKQPQRTDVRPSLHPFYITFGVQYSRTPSDLFGTEYHPYWRGADGKGWVRIMAKTAQQAMNLAFAYFGERYAFLYTEDRFDTTADRKYYPLGELAVISLGVRPASDSDGPQPILNDSESWVYGVSSDTTMGGRIQGILKDGAVSDSALKLGYEVELVHTACLTKALEAFAEVHEVDRNVTAGELDWSVPNECFVCEVSLT